MTGPAERADDYRAFTDEVRQFCAERDWGQHHTPKNLTMAIAGEAGELAAELQWIDGEESRTAIRTDAELRSRVSHEMADVLIYLVTLADVSGIDLLEAGREKLAAVRGRYPIGSGPSRSGNATGAGPAGRMSSTPGESVTG